MGLEEDLARIDAKKGLDFVREAGNAAFKGYYDYVVGELNAHMLVNRCKLGDGLGFFQDGYHVFDCAERRQIDRIWHQRCTP